MTIEQALYGSDGPKGYHFLARSLGFLEAWLPDAEKLCTGFGERPAEVACPLAVFVQPFGPRHVALVQAADQGNDDANRPGTLGFRLLIVPRFLYADLGGDPFLLSETFPPSWSARGALPSLEWTSGPPGPRTVQQIQRVLDVPYSATLLGGAQALLDGGKLAFERTAPDPHLVHSLWSLLPNSTRAELWPATFAFGNAHQFHFVVVPRANGPEYDGYVFEAQAGDYPEGRYELALQTAVEAGDEQEMAALFSRRSRSQTLRLALALLALFIFIPLFVLVFLPLPRLQQPPAPLKKTNGGPKLPRVEGSPKVNAGERETWARHLGLSRPPARYLRAARWSPAADHCTLGAARK